MATLVSPSIARRSSLWAHLQRTQNGSSKMAFFRNLFLQYLSGNLTWNRTKSQILVPL